MSMSEPQFGKGNNKYIHPSVYEGILGCDGIVVTSRERIKRKPWEKKVAKNSKKRKSQPAASSFLEVPEQSRTEAPNMANEEDWADLDNPDMGQDDIVHSYNATATSEAHPFDAEESTDTHWRSAPKKTWDAVVDVAVHDYMLSLQHGMPDTATTSIAGICSSALICQCEKQKQEIKMYYLSAHKVETFYYCKDHMPLSSVMLRCQVMPTSVAKPKVGFHFSLLDFMHKSRMIGYLSSHAWAELLNANNKFKEGYVVLSSKTTLNKAYFLYRRLSLLAEAKMSSEMSLANKRESGCELCEGQDSQIKIAMDGNMQWRRLRDKEAPLQLPALYCSEESSHLWGGQEEVEKYSEKASIPVVRSQRLSEKDDEEKKYREECIVSSLFENEHKANSDFKSKQPFIDENGIFVVSCARHGIPMRSYDIINGEGHKYSMACIQHVQEKHSQKKLQVFYDIACLIEPSVKKNFPDLVSEGRYEAATTLFHSYAHQFSCQVQKNPRLLPGFGLTDAEGVERFWSYAGGLIPLSRGMTKVNRKLTFADCVQHYKEMKTSKFASHIREKMANARSLYLSSNAELSGKDTGLLAEEWSRIKEDVLKIHHSRSKIVFGVTYDICQKLAADGGMNNHVQYLCQKSALTLFKKQTRENRLRSLSEEEAAGYRTLVLEYEKTHPNLSAKNGFMLDESTTVSVLRQVRDIVEVKIRYYIMASIAAVKFLNNEVRQKKKRHSGQAVAMKLIESLSKQNKISKDLIKAYNSFIGEYCPEKPLVDEKQLFQRVKADELIGAFSTEIKPEIQQIHLKRASGEEIKALEVEATLLLSLLKKEINDVQAATLVLQDLQSQQQGPELQALIKGKLVYLERKRQIAQARYNNARVELNGIAGINSNLFLSTADSEYNADSDDAKAEDDEEEEAN